MKDPKACVISIMDGDGNRLPGFKIRSSLIDDPGNERSIPSNGPVGIVFERGKPGQVENVRLIGPARAGGDANFAHTQSIHMDHDSYVEFRLRECQDAIAYDKSVGAHEVPLNMISPESGPVQGAAPGNPVVPLDWVPLRVTIKADTAQTGITGYLVWFQCPTEKAPITHRFRVPVGTNESDFTTRTLRLPAHRGGLVCKMRALDAKGAPTGDVIGNTIHLTVDHPKGAWITITPGSETKPSVLNLYQELMQGHKGQTVGFDYPFAAYDNTDNHGVWLGQVLDELKLLKDEYVQSRVAALNPPSNPNLETLVDSSVLAFGGHELNEAPVSPPRSYIVFSNSPGSQWTAYPWTRATETSHGKNHLTRNWRVTDMLVQWTTKPNA